MLQKSPSPRNGTKFNEKKPHQREIRKGKGASHFRTEIKPSYRNGEQKRRVRISSTKKMRLQKSRSRKMIKKGNDK